VLLHVTPSSCHALAVVGNTPVREASGHVSTQFKEPNDRTPHDHLKRMASRGHGKVEGAAMKPSDLFLCKIGEAYAYRRLAYRKMSEILSVKRSPRLATVPKEMLAAVMATKAQTT
jgi:hypothetical protein